MSKRLEDYKKNTSKSIRISRFSRGYFPQGLEGQGPPMVTFSPVFLRTSDSAMGYLWQVTTLFPSP